MLHGTEVLHNRSDLDLSPVEYGTSTDWWSFGCVVYELVLGTHKARFASSFAAILLMGHFSGALYYEG
jgi:hypothetical protein